MPALYYDQNAMHNLDDPGPLPSPKSLGTVLVVGGCGFVGHHLVDQLLNFPSEKANSSTSGPISQGPNSGRYEYNFKSLSSRYPSFDQDHTKVHALDLKCTRNRLPGCTYHEADITNVAQLLEVFKKVQPDVVINTASPQYDAPKAILQKVNIEGTRILLEVAGGMHGDWGGKCGAFVHTSSSSVVHDTQSNLRFADERWPYVVPNPVEYYSESKAVAERLVLQANGMEEVGGILTAAVRPAGITGEGDMGGIAHGLSQTASVSPGWQLNMQISDGDNLFDTTYVGNVALALLLVAEGLLTTIERRAQTGQPDGGILDHERIAGEAFIVTNDQPTAFWDITRFVYSRYGRPGITIKGLEKVTMLPLGFAYIIGLFSEIFGAITGRKGKITRQTVRYSFIDRYFSCEKLKRRCGYVPVVGVEEGLVRSVQWHRDWKEKGGEEKKQQ